MTTEYIAFDGTKFDTEKECKNYEHNISGLKLYDSQLRLLSYSEIDWAKYVIISTEQDIKYYNELCIEYLHTTAHCKIDHPGTYMWFPIAMCYVELDKAIEIYETEIELIKRVKEKLK